MYLWWQRYNNFGYIVPRLYMFYNIFIKIITKTVNDYGEMVI